MKDSPINSKQAGMVPGLGDSMADVSEDDITIIDGECAENSITRNVPLFNYNLSFLPNSAPAFSNSQTDVNDASHHALSYAYNDLKKRFNELEIKNKTLAKNWKTVQKGLHKSTDMDNRNGGLNNYRDRIFDRTHIGDILVARDTQTDSVGDTETNLLSDADQVSLLTEKLRRERLAKQDLQRTVEEMKIKFDQDICRYQEEISRLKDKVTDIDNENRDTRDENACLKRKLKDSEEALKKVTLAKLQAEKQLIQNDEYNELLISQIQERSSHDLPMDLPNNLQSNMMTRTESCVAVDTHVDEEMQKAVDLSKRLILEMSTAQREILNQKKQIQLIAENVEKKKASTTVLTNKHKWAMSDGARPKLPVQLPVRDEPQVMQCEEDLMTMQPDSPNQTMVVTSPQRKLSQGSANMGNPFHFSCSAPVNSPQPSNQMSNSSAFQHILRKKDPTKSIPGKLKSNSTTLQEPLSAHMARREPKRSHSAELSGNSIFDNNEDIYNESLLPSPRAKAYTAPPLFRHSSTGQGFSGNGLLAETGIGDSLSSPDEWTSQGLQMNNRPEPVGRCDAGDNKNGPAVPFSQPRPLNIDRNVDDDTVFQYQASVDSTNVNLFTGGNINKNGSPQPQRPELLNNDPLATSQKVIPSRNIFREGELGSETALERTDISSVVMSICPICNQTFPSGDIQDHVNFCLPEETNVRQPPGGQENDSGDKVCPMCSEIFASVVSQTDFETHVNKHFGDEILDNFEVLNP